MNHMKGILSMEKEKCKMYAKSVAEGTHQNLGVLQLCNKTDLTTVVEHYPTL